MSTTNISELNTLIKSLDGTSSLLAQQRQEFVKARQEHFKGGFSDQGTYHTALKSLNADAHYIARMASQVLDGQNLDPIQMISLKASLAQLEYEIRMFGSF